MAAKARVISSRLTSPEPSAKLGTAGSSDCTPSFRAVSMTAGMPTASPSCTATELTEVAKAVLSLYPLDTFVDDSAARMEIVGKPDEVPEVQREVQKAVDAAEGKSWPMISVERYAFYERAKQAYCVIQTGERRFYGCFAFRKGVVPPDAE